MFLETGANCNTISRRFFDQLIARGLVSEFIKGSEMGVRINLVGGQNLMISGNKIKMEMDGASNMGVKMSIREFLILETDVEAFIMGVQWHISLVGEQCVDSVGMINIDTLGQDQIL